MTTIIDSEVDALCARFGKSLAGRLEGHIERLSWDAERLAEHQRERLRALLAGAVEHSPFHARRLAGIDVERFELSQLAELPVMSKAQMMASFDELLCDRRLTRARVERQLAASAHEPSLLYDECVCLVSGGSSGLSGIFVQTIDEYIEFAASILRRAMARVIAAGGGAARWSPGRDCRRCRARPLERLRRSRRPWLSGPDDFYPRHAAAG